MNIELKPIAESKVRQLGGDVCGVLVRKGQKLAAVDEHGRTTWLPDVTDYAAISSRAISDIATVTELLGVPEEEAGRPVVELVKEYLAAQSRNSVPNEQGKNRYGLDMAYFRRLFNRELNRPLADFRPDELARVLARAARTADAAVLQEPEFFAAGAEGGPDADQISATLEHSEPEPVGFIPSSGLNNLNAGHPAKIYPMAATPSPFESHSLVYTQPHSKGGER